MLMETLALLVTLAIAQMSLEPPQVGPRYCDATTDLFNPMTQEVVKSWRTCYQGTYYWAFHIKRIDEYTCDKFETNCKLVKSEY